MQHDIKKAEARKLVDSEVFKHAMEETHAELFKELIATTSDEDCNNKRREIQAFERVQKRLQQWAIKIPK